MRCRCLIVLFALSAPGCGGAAKFASGLVQDGNRASGVCYYVGGAGQIGNVGFLSVPRGMQEGGFTGYVELVPWQTLTAAGDQINLSRNRGKGVELAERITTFSRTYPGMPVMIIALSAGTGIATFALEALPENVRVQNVAFLGCSLSSRYDLTRALKRVEGHLYTFYSPTDTVLTRIVPYTGTVDRDDAAAGVAGLEGFRLPANPRRDTFRQYQKVLNIPYQSRFAEADYRGEHMDAVERAFIARYVAPLLLDNESDLIDVAESPLGRDMTRGRPRLRPTE